MSKEAYWVSLLHLPFHTDVPGQLGSIYSILLSDLHTDVERYLATICLPLICPHRCPRTPNCFLQSSGPSSVLLSQNIPLLRSSLPLLRSSQSLHPDAAQLSACYPSFVLVEHHLDLGIPKQFCICVLILHVSIA